MRRTISQHDMKLYISDSEWVVIPRRKLKPIVRDMWDYSLADFRSSYIHDDVQYIIDNHPEIVKQRGAAF